MLFLAGGGASRFAVAQAPPDAQLVAPPPANAAEASPPAFWVTTPLPLTGTVDTQVIERIERVLRAHADGPAGAERPVLVLEFRTPTGEGGGASQFERSLALARFLTSDRLRQVRTVAFVPRSIMGHAVLPIAACEELAIAPDAELGDAAVGDSFIDPTVRRGYEEIASRRRTIPAPLALAMLDSAISVYRVRTSEGPRFVVGDELAKLQQQTAVGEIETVKREGERGSFTGRDLRLRWGVASHEATDRASLAVALRLPLAAFDESDLQSAEGWRPVRVDLRGPLSARQLQWVQKSLSTELKRGSRNLVLIWIESPGGSLVDSLSFASFVAELPETVRTVAFVPQEARGDAALIALACDQLAVGERAMIGGPGAEAPDDRTLDQLRGPLEQIAARKGRSWSTMAALVDRRATVFDCQRQVTNEKRWLSDDEWQGLADRDQWERGAAVDVSNGISGRQTLEVRLAQVRAESIDELREQFHWEGDVDQIEPNWAHRFIEGLASPQLAWFLLFLAWFALMIEFMTPNMTGAGFVAAVLFLLFFWSKFLQGTAGWLEVLLFTAGLVAVVLEVFVIPGFGVFGIGGGLLIVASLVLASQTFVIPRNAYQMSQLPASLWTVIAALAGGMSALALARRYLPRSAYFQRLTLAPLDEGEREELRRRESLVEWGHLVGQRGVAATPLVPGGKARFGGQVVDVLSEGEMVPRDAPVEVLEVLGNRVVVRRVAG
ncbi:MAG: NfeD family protein [Pirellulales bacterium]